MLNKFLHRVGLISTVPFLSNSGGNAFSYYHETLGHRSLIDFIFISSHLQNNVMACDLKSSGTNFSDHLSLNLELLISNFKDIRNRNLTNERNEYKVQRLRWDKCMLPEYYEASRQYIEPLYYELCNCVNMTNAGFPDNDLAAGLIDMFYQRFVNGLGNADKVVPRSHANFYKYWWNENLNDLKAKSIENFKLWEACGKPRCGEIFNKMTQTKLEYKSMLRFYQDESKNDFSDRLGNALIEKDQNNFWRSWNSKFGKINSRKIATVAGHTNDREIANAFCDYFSKNCRPNNSGVHEKHRTEFMEKFNAYVCDTDPCFLSSEDVGNALSKLKLGKAPGVDFITTEHLIYSHPVVITTMSKLFNLMLMCGYVPEPFRVGIVIPLIKGTNLNSTECDNYRCVTLSSIVSKVFEYALQIKLEENLATSDLQFGFKTGVGCSDALFTVKSVVDHFNKGGNTVNMAALDISKAFDRVSPYHLFNKLIQRKVPKCIISILICWFTNSSCCVRWNDKYSDNFPVRAGVKQGGVLSPGLFAIYIEDLISSLKLARKGCCIGGVYLGCVLYADDILLMSHSVTCMQEMLNICSKVASNLDLKFNVAKSMVLRIGDRCNEPCAKLFLQGTELCYVKELKYLGVYIICGRTFKCSFSSAKLKF